jgi:hypothetical protein
MVSILIYSLSLVSAREEEEEEEIRQNDPILMLFSHSTKRNFGLKE